MNTQPGLRLALSVAPLETIYLQWRHSLEALPSPEISKGTLQRVRARLASLFPALRRKFGQNRKKKLEGWPPSFCFFPNFRLRAGEGSRESLWRPFGESLRREPPESASGEGLRRGPPGRGSGERIWKMPLEAFRRGASGKGSGCKNTFVDFLSISNCMGYLQHSINHPIDFIKDWSLTHGK